MTKKLSEIVQKMAASILKKKASPEAISIALQLTHLAWNLADEEYEDEPAYILGRKEIEALLPPVAQEFVTADVKELTERLIGYKQRYYPNDRRSIFSCRYEHGKVKVAWL